MDLNHSDAERVVRRRRAEKVACPKCRAQPGGTCLNKYGRPSVDPHRERFKEAQRVEWDRHVAKTTRSLR